MSVVIILILASLAVGLIFVGAFVWAVRSGQYEDTLTPSLRVLAEDSAQPKPISISETKSSNQ
jgi:cbb3-type cytochrome oxidase maturation protein